jgi:hypothetical protein
MNHDVSADRSPVAVFLIFLRLGLMSFGGPMAHLGYFRDEFVVRRKWVSEQGYSDLVALCQFLPSPASSQVGMALGLSRAGYSGALAAWAGFTLPSAMLLILFAQGLFRYGEFAPFGRTTFARRTLEISALACCGVLRCGGWDNWNLSAAFVRGDKKIDLQCPDYFEYKAAAMSVKLNEIGVGLSEIGVKGFKYETNPVEFKMRGGGARLEINGNKIESNLLSLKTAALNIIT